MLRINSGDKKGRYLRSLSKSHPVRPLLARVKKSLFDILRPRLSGSRFLDLYAGTGAVGIEALSQGASWATFVDFDGACIRIIEENLAAIGLENKASLFRSNVLGNLSALPKPFDIIFVGTPYKDKDKNPLQLVTPTLKNIEKCELLNSNGLIIAQHHNKEKFELPSPAWTVRREEKYGDTILTFIGWA